MKKTHYLELWASAFALTLGATACTVTTGSDEETDGTEETEEGATDADSTESTDEEMTEEGEETESTATDEETEAAGETETAGETEVPGETDAVEEEPEPEVDGGADVTDPEEDVTDPEEEEPEPEPSGDRSDEYTAEAPAWDCGDRDPGDAEPINNSMEEDGTWSGTVYIDGEFRLRDAELVIEPGTRVILGADSRIVLGYNGAASTIRANGTEEEPITFCGEADDVGYWQGLVVGSNVVGVSNLSNVLVDGAGSDDVSVNASADILFDNVLIQRGADTGLRATDFDPDSTNLFIRDNNGMAVELTAADAVMAFPHGGNLTGNDEDVVHLNFVNVGVDATFRDLRVPYLFDGDEIRLRDGANMVVEAGTEFVMGADARIVAGYNGNDATIQLLGSAGNTVKFRGEAEDQGFWRSIIIADNARSNSLIQHVELNGGGSADAPVLDIDSPITIADIEIDNSGRGVRIGAEGVDEDSMGWVITGTNGEPLEMDYNAWPTLPADSQLSGNEDDLIRMTGTNFTTDGTIPNVGIPYLVTSEVRFRDGIETTIAPGTEFVMAADSRFVIGYNGNDATLIAEGTEDEPIRFTGLDSVPGYWQHILVGNNSNSSSSFDFVEIGHAGQGSAALILERAVSVTNCTFFESDSAGISKASSDDSDYATSNTFTDNAGDDVVNL